MVKGRMTGSTPTTPSISNILDSTYYSLTSNLTDAEGKKLTKLQSKVNEGKTLSGGEASLYQNLQGRSTSTGDQGMYAKMLDIQSTYGKQYVQQSLDLQKEFLPQFEQAQIDAQKQVAPGFYAAQGKLGESITSQIGQGLSKSDLSFFGQQSMQGEQSRGVAASGLGSEQTSRYLTGLNLQQKQQNEVNAQNYLNGFKLGPGDVSTAMIGEPSATASPSFSDILNQATQFSTLAYQTQATASQSNAMSMNSLFGSMFSAAGSASAMTMK
jgi:hypothetical protein